MLKMTFLNYMSKNADNHSSSVNTRL